MTDNSSNNINRDDRKDMSLKIRDNILCADGSSLIVKIEINSRSLSNAYSFFHGNEGDLIKLSIVKLKTDFIGTPTLFSRIECGDCCKPEDIEFLNGHKICKIKKELLSRETGEKFCIDISLHELTRYSTKTTITNNTIERNLIEEKDSINSSYRVEGVINKDAFSERAEASMMLEYNKKSVEGKGYYPYTY